jgi:hypothetical protein
MLVLADSLLKLSTRRVSEDLEKLREEKSKIEAQESLLVEILAIKEDHARDEAAKKPATLNKRDAIRQVFRADPDRTWSPTELRRALDDKGVEFGPKYFGISLKRLVERGDLVRSGRGAYKLASPNGDTPNLGQLDVSQSVPSRASDVRTSDE